MAETEQALQVHVTGRVQRVGFRAWTQAQAERLGLHGWVRNERDGSVRALIVGPEAAVTAMLLLLREGPRGAVVSDVVTEAVEPGAASPGFAITG
ncbi:acylphosphatase [Pseudaminobacter arsenicus]|uniref:acylphosphatase n=1 Tax=Borborobacter arsenicus TaxID=1851146 RepID=A0A432V0D0_9HYPH|nr:acylphosphatase [Pseudaminobacter arsenicus]RUM95667.1 acylphosphatase [Pseudaminobacter arsenicus]